jgi:hypothetical protein
MDFGRLPLGRDVLDEDLQIVQATLTMISGDVRRLSQDSACALEEAIQKVDEARRAIPRDRLSHPSSSR